MDDKKIDALIAELLKGNSNEYVENTSLGYFSSEPRHNVVNREQKSTKDHLPIIVLGIVIIVVIATVLIVKGRNRYQAYETGVSTIEEDVDVASTDATKNDYNSPLYNNPLSEIMGDYSGTISKTSEARMKVDSDGNGTFGYDCNGSWVERIVKLSTFDQSTNHLVFKEYDKSGSYIGEFDGICSHGNYNGTFTNYKGASVPFDLYNHGM